MMGAPKPDKDAPILPTNWPEDVPFLYAPRYSPALTEAQKAAIRVPPPPAAATTAAVPRSLRRGPCPAVEIRTITDPRHPACGQRGLFAARRLEPGALILPYLGELHPGSAVDQQQEGDGYDYAKSDYDLWLSRDADVAVDAARCGNEARFVNDYRGVPGAVRANAEFREVWDPRPQPRPRAVEAEGDEVEDASGERRSALLSSAKQAPVVAGEWTMAVFVLPVGKKALVKHQQKQQQQQRQQQRQPQKKGKGARGRGGVATGGRKERPLGGINEGEEILVSYGKGFWETRKHGDNEGGESEEGRLPEASQPNSRAIM